MIRVRLSRFSIAAAMLVLAAGPVRADPQPTPPPQPSGPQPVPYPGGPEEPPPPACEHTICLPKPGATQEGVAAKKHIGQVKYEDFAKSGDAQVIEAQSISWGKLDAAGTVYSADPMEGGQIAGRYRPGRQKPGRLTDATVNSADPMEGGQVTARTYQPGKPTYGNVTFDKQTASAEPGAEIREPGKPEYPNVQGAEVTAKTAAKFKTLAGACTNGTHIKEAIIVTRSGRFTLHDATVVSVTPAESVDGKPMEEVTVAYESVDN